jgi:hypothetical protein
MRARRSRPPDAYDLPHIKKLSTPAWPSERHGASLVCLLRMQQGLLRILQGAFIPVRRLKRLYLFYLSVGENIIFRPSSNWRKDAKEEKPEASSMREQLKNKTVKCRICSGEHFTSRCPFKDTMAPVGEEGSADPAAGLADADGPAAAGGLGTGKSSYVPPHMRNGGGASAAGDRMGGGKYERDDLATLRVTNVSLSLTFHLMTVANTTFRFPKWQRSKNFETCLSDLVASLVSSLRRTERLDWRRALRSLVSRSVRMLQRRVRRWMAMVSST